jgi:cytosine/adenosine deaminase-related metal-dependent hydrolase
VLIKGAIILSQDPTVGDYAAGDILIRDGGIAQVAEDLARQADGAVVIDAAGTIACPGFVDAQVHAWKGQLRGATHAGWRVRRRPTVSDQSMWRVSSSNFTRASQAGFRVWAMPA